MWIWAVAGWNQLEKHSPFEGNWQDHHPWRAGLDSWTEQREHSAPIAENLRGTKKEKEQIRQNVCYFPLVELWQTCQLHLRKMWSKRDTCWRVMSELSTGASPAAWPESSGVLDSSSLLLLAGLFIMDGTQSARQTLLLPAGAPRPWWGSGAAGKPGPWNTSCVARHYAAS